MCALWNPVRSERKQIVTKLGDGINTAVPPFDIKDSELTYVRNMGSQEYPAITTRYGRTAYSTNLTGLTTPYAIGERNNSQLHVVDGNTWKYWNTATTSFTNLTTSLTGTDAEILDFATGTQRYTVLMNSTQKLIWDGSSTALVLGDGSTPFSNIFTVHKYKMYIAKNNMIYYSATNNPNDWTTPQDSGIMIWTKSKGNISGLCEYNDHVIIFTEYGMHELYGNREANFEPVNVEGEIGCISHRSITKCNKRLYWLWNDGVYSYDGSTPVKISAQVDSYIQGITFANRSKAVGGSNGDILYMAIPYGSSENNLILTYDTINKIWMVETGNIVDFVTIQNKLYGLDSTGGINDMRDLTATKDNGTEITWELITKAFTDNTVSQKKTLTDVSLIYKASTSATLTASYSTSESSTSFTTLSSSSDFNLSNVTENERLLIPSTDLQNVDFYRLRLNGTGKVTFNKLEKDYRINRR